MLKNKKNINFIQACQPILNLLKNKIKKSFFNYYKIKFWFKTKKLCIRKNLEVEILWNWLICDIDWNFSQTALAYLAWL